jgi:hypothetical protein
MTSDLDGASRLRAALRDAFDRSPDLEPPANLTAKLRARLEEEADPRRSTGISRRSWLGLAAGLVLTIGLTGRLITDRAAASAEALARDAIGDHRNCALKYRLARTPVPLPEAAARFDTAYRLLMTAPPDEVPAPGGAIHVLERHACAYDGRRFGHVIMQYRGHVVSLLMTAGSTAAGSQGDGTIAHAIGQPVNGLSVVSMTRSGRSILLVGDLEHDELTELSRIVAEPLAQRLAGGLLPAASPVIVAALHDTLPRIAVRE